MHDFKPADVRGITPYRGLLRLFSDFRPLIRWSSQPLSLVSTRLELSIFIAFVPLPAAAAPVVPSPPLELPPVPAAAAAASAVLRAIAEPGIAAAEGDEAEEAAKASSLVVVETEEGPAGLEDCGVQVDEERDDDDEHEEE